MIILQAFIFDNISSGYKGLCFSAPSVHPRVHFFKVFFFVSCFPTIALNRTKLKYGAMKLKAHEKIIWMIELGSIYLLGPKGSLLVHPESLF